MTRMTGGCACGAVRYEASAEPAFTAHCFCTDCQKLGGSQMSTTAFVPRAAFRLVKGELSHYDTTGDSGRKVHRHFCPYCGTHVYSEPEVLADLVGLKVGGLDDPGAVKPAMSVYCASAPSWAAIPQDIPQHAKMPPM